MSTMAEALEQAQRQADEVTAQLQRNVDALGKSVDRVIAQNEALEDERDALKADLATAAGVVTQLQAERDALSALCDATADLHAKAVAVALEATTRAETLHAERDEAVKRAEAAETRCYAEAMERQDAVKEREALIAATAEPSAPHPMAGTELNHYDEPSAPHRGHAGHSECVIDGDAACVETASVRRLREQEYPESRYPTHPNPFPNGRLVEWDGRYWAPALAPRKIRGAK